MDWLGLIAGMITADWWSLFTTLVGAVIGAAVSYVIASQAAREARELQRQERLDRDKGTAHALTVKLMRLLNSLAGFNQQTEDSIKEAEKHIPESPLWTKMLPLAGTENSLILIEPSEWAILVAAKEFDLLNRAIMLCDRYNGLVHVYTSYSSERKRLTDQFGAAMEGKIGTSLFTQEERSRFEPRAVALEDHAKAVRGRISELMEEARDLLPKIGPVVRTYLNDPTFPILTLTDSDAVAKQ